MLSGYGELSHNLSYWATVLTVYVSLSSCGHSLSTYPFLPCELLVRTYFSLAHERSATSQVRESSYLFLCSVIHRQLFHYVQVFFTFFFILVVSARAPENFHQTVTTYYVSSRRGTETHYQLMLNR